MRAGRLLGFSPFGHVYTGVNVCTVLAGLCKHVKTSVFRFPENAFFRALDLDARFN